MDGKGQESYRVRNIMDSLRKESRFQVRVPGSKSITNRALLLAMLSDGDCTLKGALFSDDSRYLQRCIADLGFEISGDETQERIQVKGLGGSIPLKEASLYVGSAGTAARFLTALLGLREGAWRLDASEQMRRRPMKPLLDCLEELGVQVGYEGQEGHFPFTLHPQGKKKGRIQVDIENSSQFLSALLIAAGSGRQPMEIQTKGSHGMAYIHMTLRMMEQFGVNTEKKKDGVFLTGGGGGYRHRDYEIEPDVSAACYFYGMAAVLGIEGCVMGVHEGSLQGDMEFLRILERMGCRMWETPEGICLQGPEGGKLHGLEADMHACSDQAITLAAIAPYADGPVKLTGIGHIRFQESDRLAAIAENLAALGIRCEGEEEEGSLTIYPGTPSPGRIRTHDDHRLAMGFSLTGLRTDGVVIQDPGCCRKTFEQYFQVLEQVIEQIREG